jgi:phage terminase small subunit
MNGSKPLDNQRHERFAQHVANGASATQAYIDAGYSETGANAHSARLAANGSVASRIDYLKPKPPNVP